MCLNEWFNYAGNLFKNLVKEEEFSVLRGIIVEVLTIKEHNNT